jgi:tetratricopeptide (TPR) repeat protein
MPAWLILLVVCTLFVWAIFVSEDEILARYHAAAIEALDSGCWVDARIAYERLMTQKEPPLDVQFGMALSLDHTGEPELARLMMERIAPIEKSGFLAAHYWCGCRLMDQKSLKPEEVRAVQSHLLRVVLDVGAQKSPVSVESEPVPADGDTVKEAAANHPTSLDWTTREWLKPSEYADARRRLARVLIMNRQYGDALPHLQVARYTDPSLHFALASILALQGKTSESRVEAEQLCASLTQLLAEQPDDLECRLQLVRVLTFSKDFMRAIAVLHEGLKLAAPDDTDVSGDLKASPAGISSKTSRVSSSVATSPQKIEDIEKSQPAEEAHDPAKRQEILRHALAAVHIAWAKTWRPNAKPPVDRVQLLGKALFWDQWNFEAIMLLLTITRPTAEESQEISRLLGELDGLETPAAVHYGLGRRAEDRSELALAKKHYRLALQKEPGMVAAANNLAWLEAATESSRLDDALELIDRALRQRPNQPNMLDTRATILFKLERWADAARDLEAILLQGAGTAGRHRILADCYDHVAKPDLAVRHRNSAQEIEDKQRKEQKGNKPASNSGTARGRMVRLPS